MKDIKTIPRLSSNILIARGSSLPVESHFTVSEVDELPGRSVYGVRDESMTPGHQLQPRCPSVKKNISLTCCAFVDIKDITLTLPSRIDSTAMSARINASQSHCLCHGEAGKASGNWKVS